MNEYSQGAHLFFAMTLSVLVTIICEVSGSSAVLVLYRDYVANRIDKATMQTKLRELITRDHLKMSVKKKDYASLLFGWMCDRMGEVDVLFLLMRCSCRVSMCSATTLVK
jgi:hypothetical protein